MPKLDIEGLTHITFNKWLDVIKPLNNYMSIEQFPYSQLESVLETESIIKVTYVLGQQNLRAKQLQQLGFYQKEVLWNDATERHHRIISIWERDV